MGEECKEEFFRELIEKANQMRIEVLFEEPCPLYAVSYTHLTLPTILRV